MRHTQKHRIICAKLGVKDFFYEVLRLYTLPMSGNEIAEYIEQNTGEKITARSIQRSIHKLEASRTVKDAYNLCIKRGRMHWVYKKFKYKRVRLSPKTRYSILKRDGFTCVLCGNRPPNTILEVDHIVPICKGGRSNEENLRTLCYECNKGKQYKEKEV